MYGGYLIMQGRGFKVTITIRQRIEQLPLECSTCGLEHLGYCKREMNRGWYRSQIVDLVSSLEFQQFQYPDDKEARARVLETRALALEQLEDDVFAVSGSRRDRVGRAQMGWVLTGYQPARSDERDVYELWPAYTEDDEALQLALEPFLGRLTPEQRALVRLHFDGRESMNQIATRLGVAKSTIQKRLNTVYVKLREMLSSEFETEPEVISV